MKQDPIIRANILARQGKYESALRILESEENRYFKSFNYCYLTGMCHLYSRAHGNALANFRKAREIKMRDPMVLLGLAALYLNHGDTERAVDTYLEVLEIDEHNKLAAKALNIIRKNPGPENIASWIDRGRLHTLFPPFPKIPSSGRRTLKIFLAAIPVLVLALGMAFYTGFFSFGNRNTREAPLGIELLEEDLNAPMQLEGSFRYVMTRTEINNYYNEARRFFASYNDERARVNLNRILESNGPEPVKNKARLLVSYLETPGFDTLKDRFSYTEINTEPVLYRGCHVIWRGIATNIEIRDTATSFDLLVGYDTRRTMEGIVRVDFDFAVPVNHERPAEVLGRVVLFNSERGLDFRILGIALNQSLLLENQ